MFDFHFHITVPPNVGLSGSFGPQIQELPVATKTVTIGDGPFKLTLRPQHNGRPVAVDGPATIVLEEPSLFTVAADGPAGLTFTFTDTGAVGTTRGRAVVDARLGVDVLEKTFEFELSVQLPEADQLVGEFGDQAVPEKIPA